MRLIWLYRHLIVPYSQTRSQSKQSCAVFANGKQRKISLKLHFMFKNWYCWIQQHGTYQYNATTAPILMYFAYKLSEVSSEIISGDWVIANVANNKQISIDLAIRKTTFLITITLTQRNNITKYGGLSSFHSHVSRIPATSSCVKNRNVDNRRRILVCHFHAMGYWWKDDVTKYSIQISQHSFKLE